MVKRVFTILACLLILGKFQVFSQSNFFKTYGKLPQDYFYTLHKTLDGGFVLSGTSNGYGVSNGLYIVKTDVNGDTLWMKGYGTNNNVFGYSVFACSDSGFVVCGNTGFVRVDKNGAVIWDLIYNGIAFYSVQQTSDKGFILAGSIGQTNGSNGMDVFLLKTDSMGTKQWARKIGGPSDEYACCIRQTTDGGYVFAGTTDSYGAGGTDIYVVKTNSLGDTLWTKTYGGLGNEGGVSSARQTVECTYDKGFIVGAYTSSFGAGGTDAYLLKVDSTGSLQWSKTYGGSGSELINDVKQTIDSGYVFVGYTSSFGAGASDMYLVKTNALGDTLFTRTYGGSLTENATAVLQNSDKGFAISGYTNDFGSGNNDGALIKTDSMGNAGCHQLSTGLQIGNPNTVVGNTSTGKIFITLVSASTLPTAKRGGLVVDACTQVGVAYHENKNAFLVFPNPGNGNFTLVLGQVSSKKITVNVITVLGETVFSAQSNTNAAEIDLTHLPAGTYLLQVQDGTGIYTRPVYIVK